MSISQSLAPTVLLAALSASAMLLLPSAAPQSVSVYPGPVYASNLLGNGGFEFWGQGQNGSIPPEEWDVMGDAANTFANHGSLIIERVAGSADCDRRVAGGESALKLTPLQVGAYISQSFEKPTEFRCKPLTFTAYFRTDFTVSSPTITIDDGISESSDSRLLVVGEWRALTVTHTVSQAATKLEVKIVPGNILVVDDAQLVLGSGPARFAPVANNEPAQMQLPLGSIIDWYRFDAAIPVPEGFVIADGSVVADAQSPLFGRNTPNLSGRFVRGVTSLAEIGTSGGTDSHDLTHNHNFSHTHTTLQNTSSWWWVPSNGGPFQCPKHTITYQTGQPIGEPIAGNRTSNELGQIDNKPAFVGLLKLVRVR